MEIRAVKVPVPSANAPVTAGWQRLYELYAADHMAWYNHTDYLSHSVERFLANQVQGGDPERPEETYVLLARGEGRVSGPITVSDEPFDDVDPTAIVGFLRYSYYVESAEGVAFPAIFVDADWRRRGIGTAAMEFIRSRALADSRRILEAWAPGDPDAAGEPITPKQGAGSVASGDTGAAFLTALDYRLELVENSSSLDLTNAEKVRKLRELERRGRERLGGDVEVRVHSYTLDDEALSALAEARNAFEQDYPQGENADRIQRTPEQLRSEFDRALDRLTDGISVLIHEKASGVVVAGTGLEYKVGGRRAYQEWTWVSPDHRGAGLATYVKAVTYVHAIDHLPNIEVVETENAEENEAMWAVNEKLGFERSSLMTNWFSFYDGDAWRPHP